MVMGPTAHPHDENYHPANGYAKFLEERGHTVQYCPFVELIELCGEMVGIDVLAIGKDNNRFCGSVTPAHRHESGSVYMTCQKVAMELQVRLRKLEAKPVTDDELSRLREMEPTNRQDVFNRLNYADEQKELIKPIYEVYGKQFPHLSLHDGALEWAKERLDELMEKAAGGKGLWHVNCPQAPKRPGPMIRY